MNESERLQRMNENCHDEERDVRDEEFANRIASFLNHPCIDKYCMVDAYYYDFSVIPRGIQEKLQLWRDSYLLYGITTEGEIVSKWVDRWDLDSCDPVVDGKVMHGEKPRNNIVLPEIRQCFDPKLLATPAPEFLKLFGGK